MFESLDEKRDRSIPQNKRVVILLSGREPHGVSAPPALPNLA